MMSGLVDALVGVVSVAGMLVVAWWQRERDRRAGDRADRDDHRAAAAALLAAALALADYYERLPREAPGRHGAEEAGLVRSLRVAAAGFAWPGCSAGSAACAAEVYEAAGLASVDFAWVPGRVSGLAPVVFSGAGTGGLRAVIREFDAVAAAEARGLGGRRVRVTA
jgi:hypothetical protein